MGAILRMETGIELRTGRKLFLVQSGGHWREVSEITVDGEARLGALVREGIDFELAPKTVFVRDVPDELILSRRQTKSYPEPYYLKPSSPRTV